MKKVIAIIICLLTTFLTACSSFDADGYVKALLDNTYKGERAALVRFSKRSEAEIEEIYQSSIDNTCSELLSGVTVSDSLSLSYQSFVQDMMSKADYTVDSRVKNKDGSYSVTVLTRKMILTVNDAISSQTNFYIEDLQKQVETGNASLSKEDLQEQTYQIMLQCYVEALQNAAYEDPVSHTVAVTRIGRTYHASQDDLSEIAQDLFLIQ